MRSEPIPSAEYVLQRLDVFDDSETVAAALNVEDVDDHFIEPMMEARDQILGLWDLAQDMARVIRKMQRVSAPKLTAEDETRMMTRKEASAYLEGTFGLRCKPATLAKQASLGTGPRYRSAGKRQTLYARSDLDEWARTFIRGIPR